MSTGVCESCRSDGRVIVPCDACGAGICSTCKKAGCLACPNGEEDDDDGSD